MINLLKGFQEGLRPTEELKVWEWADKYRMLSSVSSAEPGRWRTDRVPYMKEPFEKMSSSDPCREINLMKGVQVAGTEVALNLVGYSIDCDPCPIMYVMPTVDMAKQLSKKRLKHLIDECPSLKSKVQSEAKKDGSSTMLEKNFSGGSLSLTGANSASGLRSNPVRKLILDETDAYPLNVGEEGSPIKLAEARTSTFSKNKKIFRLSTPTLAGTSVIADAISKTDQRKYQVPCPHCGGYQDLRFGQLKWENRDPSTVKYECEHCEELIEEKYKTVMLDNNVAYWKPTVPEKTSKYKVGYIINSLYSPLGWISWEEIVTKFLEDKDDPVKFRTFVNTILGEPWEDRGDAPEWEYLFNRRESYKMNHPQKAVEMVTVGVDVQKDRLELEVVGWTRDKTTWSIDYRVLPGDTSEKDVWDLLGKVVEETWVREDGAELPMMRMAVDANYNTTHVYDFCRRYDASKVIPIQGRDSQKVILAFPKPIDIAKSGKKIGKLKVWGVGVGLLKSELYANLKKNVREDGTLPAGYCHFPEYGVDFFKGITAERLKIKTVRGYPKYEWTKEFNRNEPIDCRNYARAAATAVGIDRFNDGHWDEMAQNLAWIPKEGKTAIPARKKQKRKSDFWGDR